jgi:hypothetical protein
MASLEATDDVVGLQGSEMTVSYGQHYTMNERTQVVMKATASSVTIPGTSPRMSNAFGIDRTPMPTWVLVMSAVAPTHPTCTASVTFCLSAYCSKSYAKVDSRCDNSGHHRRSLQILDQ